MSELDFDARLGGQLRAYAQGGVRPIDRYAIAVATIEAGSPRRPSFHIGRPRGLAIRSTRRMALILVAVATVLALAGGALLLSAGHPPALTPTPAPVSPTPSLTTPKPAVSGTSRYQAIFMRATSGQLVEGAYTIAPEIDIVAMRNDGQERLVRHLSSSMLPAGRSFRLGGSVSEDGWLAVATYVGQPDNDFAYALIDLRHPERELQLEPSVLGAGWGPGGLFATAISCCWRVEIVDAETGSRSTRINAVSLPGGGPDIIWAADGSGLLVNWPNGRARFGIAPLAGGSPVSVIPPLVWPRLESRWVAAGGAELWQCRSGTYSPCNKTPQQGVRTQDALGNLTEWYSSEPAAESLLDASFSADGRSVWLLLDRTEGTRHVAVIALADTPGAVRIVATVDPGTIVAGTRFGLAPDDSTVVLFPSVGPAMLVDATTGTVRTRAGNLVGFAPASLADAWPGGGSFNAVPDATAPPTAAPSAVPSVP